MSPPGRPKGEYRSAQREGTSFRPPGRPKGEYRSAQREGTSFRAAGRPKVWLFAALLTLTMPVSAQSIFKCKGADGRITYSSGPCAGEGATLPNAPQGRPAAVTANTAASATAPSAAGPTPPPDDAAVPPTTYRAPLPKKCDNQAPLHFVVTRLDSAATPDDVRSFLADERFRLLRCEFTRFSAEELRVRDAAMRDLETRDIARRRAAILRVEMLYDRYLTPDERTARSRDRQR